MRRVRRPLMKTELRDCVVARALLGLQCRPHHCALGDHTLTTHNEWNCGSSRATQTRAVVVSVVENQVNDLQYMKISSYSSPQSPVHLRLTSALGGTASRANGSRASVKVKLGKLEAIINAMLLRSKSLCAAI